jgi:hypothetical protein
MSQVQRLSGPRETPARLPQLSLRAWELGGLVALCLLLLGFLTPVLTRWLPEWWMVGHVPPASTSVLLQAMDGWRQAAFRLVRRLVEISPGGSELSAIWIYGAVAFAVAMALLLGWRPAGDGSRRLEDVHV